MSSPLVLVLSQSVTLAKIEKKTGAHFQLCFQQVCAKTRASRNHLLLMSQRAVARQRCLPEFVADGPMVLLEAVN